MAKEGKQQKGTRSTQEDDRSRSQQQSQSQTALSRRQKAMPGLIANPFSFMRRFGEGMEQLFADFGGGGMMRGFGDLAAWSPQVEMFEREGQLVIRVDLPGMKKDDVRVDLRDDSIVLRGQRQEEHREEREGFYRTERSYGSFYREIPLPEGVDPDDAAANFRDGVLEITMPIEETERRGRQLEIQEASRGEQDKQKTRAAGAGR